MAILTSWHKNLTAEMALQALTYEVMIFIERMRTATREAPPGPQLFSDVALAQMPASAMLVDVLQRSLSGGDPDGSPAKALLDAKRAILDFHLDAAKRLGADVEVLQRRVGK